MAFALPVPSVTIAATTAWPRPQLAVYRAAVDGSSCNRVFAGPRGATVARLSPNGLELAYVSPSGRDVLVARLGGGSRRVLHLPSATPERPDWSPDGSRLVVARGPHLYLARADGGAAQVLTPRVRSDATYAAPAWSPKGDLIAVSTTWGNGKAGTLRNELDLL